MKFHLDNNTVEGTPEELVKYQELLEEKEKEEALLKSGHMHVGYQPSEEEFQDTFQGILGSLKIDNSYVDSTGSSTDEAETSSTELQVGDRVKVLKSEGGAVGEATVSAVLERGDVALAGTNKGGRYLTNWSNHVSNLEKIEEEDTMGYTFWYIGGSSGFNNRNVLKTTLEGHFEDSKGRRYTYQKVQDSIYPITTESVRKHFEEAKHEGSLLKYYSSLDAFIREQ